MAAAAQARLDGATVPRRRDEAERTATRPAAPPAERRAPRTRARAAQRARFTRAFVVFAVCLTVLAVGRVALSFAVVQKSLQTDAVSREERRVSAENAQLAEEVAQLSSTLRIRHIAENQLGLVDATAVTYLRVVPGEHVAKVAERP
jgi:cell division protein FtsL